MSKEKTGLGKFLAKIGNIFKGLFDVSQKTYDKLPKETQDAMLNGSLILKIINDNTDKTPETVITLILRAVPTLTRYKLQEGLNKVAEGLNLSNGMQYPTLEEVVFTVMKHLEKAQGEIWQGISSLAAKLLAVFLAPKETRFAVIEQLLTFVYQKYIKK